ncbi:MAG TPA: hypothetical protein RMH99_26315 [Sandaracinaceae bacterium LLY-WYZ-13_1]|nr:hypothetical protein [Sandaracinaceae bacterium LLY-WYZ-13_1]
MKIRLVFGARSLVGAHDGLDRHACATRYAELLTEALRREWPRADVLVTWVDERRSTRAIVEDATSSAEARGVERDALDLAWAVRQTAAWPA